MFKCMTCFSTYESNDDDTLLYEEVSKNNVMLFGKILNKAAHDPVNMQIKTTCPKCKYGFAKTVQIGDDMKLINICRKCEFQWLNI